MSDVVHAGLERWAALRPDAPALVVADRVVSYETLNRLANRFAHLFEASGVVPGERVVLALENGVNLVAAYFGVLKAGAVAVPMPAGARSDRLPAAIADCRPRVCVIDGATARGVGPGGITERVPMMYVDAPGVEAATGMRPLAPALAACGEEARSGASGPGDLAAIIYTSGSTGEPRGVMLSHGNFVANARSIVAYLGLTKADRVMCVLPFSYVYGLSILHTHIGVGGSLVVENRAAFPNVVLASMAEHAVTGFAGVPSTFALMLHRSNLDEVHLPHLRYVTQAGGPMSPSRIDEWLARGPKADFYVMYGATEAAARLTYLPPAELARKRGSIGRAIPDVEVRVLTDDGRVAQPGEVGELVARGPNIASGYWNRPEETAERFGAEGYRTGDLGYADDDGCLYIVGRRHDMIKVGANRVGAREIEDVLHEHPAVHEAAVVATPHDLLGEAPVALVSLKGALADAETELRAFCATRLTAYKVPVRVTVVTELPKLPATGKVDRQAVRARAIAAIPSAPQAAG